MKKLKKGMYVRYIRSATHDTVSKVAKIKEEEKHLITLDIREQFNNEKYVVNEVE